LTYYGKLYEIRENTKKVLDDWIHQKADIRKLLDTLIDFREDLRGHITSLDVTIEHLERTHNMMIKSQEESEN